MTVLFIILVLLILWCLALLYGISADVDAQRHRIEPLMDKLDAIADAVDGIRLKSRGRNTLDDFDDDD